MVDLSLNKNKSSEEEKTSKQSKLINGKENTNPDLSNKLVSLLKIILL